jgi:hypothetical protein
MPHRALVAVAAALCVAIPLTAAAPPAGAAPPPAYQPPVDAPVVDPFRPPATPYGPGNRGLDYGTAAGTEVRAAAGGVVTFAGLVAGSRHVTVLHPDGLRTTYSFLARVDVVVGQRVGQGDVLGTTVGSLHFGARLGDAYLDPAALFGGGPPHVELVPFDEAPGPGPRGERSAIRQLIGGFGSAIGSVASEVADRALDGTGATITWLRDEGGQVARTAVHYLSYSMGYAQLQMALEVWSAASAAAHRDCTEGSAAPPVPVERRVAVLVAGLGSTSESGAIDDVDTGLLGYDAGDVVRFSYEGGRTPDASDGFSSIEATAYGPAATQTDLRASGRRLADLVEEVTQAAPGVPIDLYAHSQGGVVTRLALVELEARHGAAWLARLGLVATLGTPHGGADLATAAYAIGSTQAGSRALDGFALATGLELDDDATATAQLAETSGLIADLAEAPLPAGVDGVSIAARGDLVVPVPRTRLPGAPQVVVGVTGLHAHDALPGSPEAARELSLALAGLPPTCTSLWSALTDQIVGQGISAGEDSLGALGWYASLRHGLPFGG